MSVTGRCVAGIDGGASSTRAALFDESLNVLATGLGGPADHFSAGSGRDRLRQSLRDATSPLLTALREEPGLQLCGVCLGLTGVSIPGKREAATNTLEEVFPGLPLIIEGDTVTAWAGAHAGQDGVVVISGTGSVAYGRRGETVGRAGGFGYLLGDEGSGFRISLAAISAALRASDRTGPATSLTEVVRSYFDVSTIRQVPGKVYGEGVSVDRIAALCPEVVREAGAGDGVAQRILNEAGRDLGRIAVAALESLGPTVNRISYVGGVFKSGEAVLKPFIEHIAMSLPRAEVVPPAHSPLTGAGILAWSRLSQGGRQS